jgi:hypothetical protein
MYSRVVPCARVPPDCVCVGAWGVPADDLRAWPGSAEHAFWAALLAGEIDAPRQWWCLQPLAPVSSKRACVAVDTRPYCAAPAPGDYWAVRVLVKADG